MFVWIFTPPHGLGCDTKGPLVILLVYWIPIMRVSQHRLVKFLFRKNWYNICYKICCLKVWEMGFQILLWD
jgi:hypothetical protein